MHGPLEVLSHVLTIGHLDTLHALCTGVIVGVDFLWGNGVQAASGMAYFEHARGGVATLG
jgi:hypothetical protein